MALPSIATCVCTYTMGNTIHPHFIRSSAAAGAICVLGSDFLDGPRLWEDVGT